MQGVLRSHCPPRCPSATQMVDADDFVEMTKSYAQGIVPPAPRDGCSLGADKNRTANGDAGIREVKKQKKRTLFSVYSLFNIHKCLVCVFSGQHKVELVSSGHKKACRSSWGFGRSAMLLDSKQAGAFKKAMDVKSRLMV